MTPEFDIRQAAGSRELVPVPVEGGGRVDFPDWLDKELADRGMKPQDLARAADLDPATVSNIRAGKPIGVEASRKIAKALELPQWVVFFAAGLLTEPPDDIGQAMNPVRASINRELRKAGEFDLRLIYAMIRTLTRYLGQDDGTEKD